MLVLDATVVVRWFVERSGSDHAGLWLDRLVDEPDLLVGPDLLTFEVHGALARLQDRRDPDFSRRAFARFARLGIRALPTSAELFERALLLSRTLRIGGYDAIYLAHAESLGVEWLTADERALRRLGRDPRVRALGPP